MSYQFDPRTDEELDTFDLMEDGVYSFEVAKSTKKISKSGNPMAELQLRVWDKSGKVKFVFDYLVFSSVNLNIRKIKHFCDTVGLVNEYKSGNLPEDLSGYSGKVEVATQDKMPKPNGGFYDAKNVVVDYVMTDNGAVKHESANDNSGMKPLPETKDDFADDIPF